MEQTCDTVQQNIGRKYTNGPEGTIAQKTLLSVKMVTSGVNKIHQNIQKVKPDYSANLHSCLTVQVESMHATHHFKQPSAVHMLEYARSFGNTVKESLKRTTKWAAHYFTHPASYYPIPENNNICFWQVPKLEI